jgi:ribosomal protein S17
MTRTCIKRAKKSSPRDTINASFVAGNVCKTSVTAVQLNLTVTIRAEGEKKTPKYTRYELFSDRP